MFTFFLLILDAEVICSGFLVYDSCQMTDTFESFAVLQHCVEHVATNVEVIEYIYRVYYNYVDSSNEAQIDAQRIIWNNSEANATE